MQDKFLTTVAKRVLGLMKSHQQLCVVLPNQRAGLFLKQRIAELIDAPIFLPKIYTIEEYFASISGLIKVDQTEQLLRLYESHLTVADEPETFDQFLTWGPTFLADCGEIDTNLIDAELFFDTLYNDREIRNWNVADGKTEMQEKYLDFWKRAKALYFNFTSNLLNDGRAYNGLSYRYACENLEQFVTRLSCNYSLFVGFNALNQAEQKLFEFVEEKAIGEFIWDTDAYYINNVENKAGMYFRRYRKLWESEELHHPPNYIGEQTKQINIIQAPNEVAQCDIVAKMVMKLHKEGKINADTAIILGDEQLLEPLLYRLPNDIGEYNITMGKPLAQFPLYQFFDQFLAVKQNSVSRDNQIGVLATVLNSFLASPYLQQIDTNNEGRTLNEYITTNNVSIVWANNIAQLVQGNLLASLFTSTIDLKTLLNEMHFLVEQLRGQFMDVNNRFELQVLFELKKIIQQFESFYEEYQFRPTVSSFRQMLRQVARSTKIPYEGEPLQGLQIMGVLETRALDFKNIIFLSANEGVLPKGRTGNSFIPYIFKEYFTIQTYKDKDAIYAYSIYRLLHHAETIQFIYNGEEGQLGGGELSRFAQQIASEFNDTTTKQVPIKEFAVAFPLPNLSKKEEYTIEKTPEIISKLKAYLQKETDFRFGLSPSSLRLLVTSPLDFYLQKIAYLKEPTELETDIEANTFGTIVHQTLEELYKPFVGQILTDEMLKQIEQKVDKTLTDQYLAVYKKGNTERGLNYLSKLASAEIVKRAIALDRQRIKIHTIELIALEQPLKYEFPLQLPDEQFIVKMGGTADRVQKRDGTIEIIDYKTGKVDPKFLTTDEIDNIQDNPELEKLNQLLAYVLMASEGKETHYPLADIRAGMQPLKSWDNGIEFLNGDEHYTITQHDIDSYKQQLQIILENLLNPELPFTPSDPKSNPYSPYLGIYS